MAACMFRPRDIAPCQRQCWLSADNRHRCISLPDLNATPPQQPPENEPQRRTCFDST